MTIRINIEADPTMGDMGDQIERAMSALGFFRLTVSTEALAKAEAAANRYDGLGATVPASAQPPVDNDHVAEGAQQFTEAETEADKSADVDTRPVGQPADGNKRRNSAEKAEDDELEALAASKGISLDTLNGAIAKAGRAEAVSQLRQMPDRAEDEKPAISTGENRVGPEDDPETEAQDAADEAAETAAAGGLDPLDELRRLVGRYQKQFGMPAAAKLFEEGGLVGKGMIELDDDEIAKAIADLKAKLDGDPGEIPASLDRRGAKTEEKPATKADLVEAMMRYADKFDGTRDQAQMVATMEDCPKVFQLCFGESVTKLSQVPEDGYAKAIAGIEEAIVKNPFKRDVKGGA